MNLYFVAHYKSVNSNNEFYSKKRESLDFPTQIEFKKERYLLQQVHQVSSLSQELNLKKRLSELKIAHDVDVER